MNSINSSRRLGTLLLCLLYLTAGLEAATREMKLKWSELGAHIAGHKVSLTSPDGHYLEGEVISVQSEALEMNVNKTSDRQAIAKGKHSFVRSSVSQIGLKTKRMRGRVIGVSTGLGVGVGSIAVGYSMQSWGGLGVALIGAIVGVGVMVAGYFIGNEHDRQLTMITVLPD